MITFHELSFRNFLSYGNNLTRLALNFKQPTLIVGKNYDSVVDGQIDSNGSGKSTILNAVSYVLFDKAISDIDKGGLINNINKKNMEVSIIFEKDDLFYKIERYRKHKQKGGDGVRIYINKTNVFTQEHDKTPDSVTNANKEIERILEIPFDIFARIVVFKASYLSFLNLSVSQQRDIIEELFGLTELSQKAEILKEKLKNNKTDLSNLILINTQLINEREKYSTQIEFTRNKVIEWSVSHSAEISQKEDRFNYLANIDFMGQREIFEELKNKQTQAESIKYKKASINDCITNAMKTLNNKKAWEENRIVRVKQYNDTISALSNLNFNDEKETFKLITELDIAIEAFDRQNKDSEKLIKSKTSEISHAESELGQLSNNICPYCKQEFVDVKDKIKHITDTKDEIAKCIAELSTLVISTQDKINALLTEKSEHKNSLSYKSINDLTNDENKYKIALEQIKLLESEQNPYDDVDTLKLGEYQDAITILNTDESELNVTIGNLQKYKLFTTERELIQLEAEYDSIELEINKLKDRINPYDEVLSNLLKTKFDSVKNKEIDVLQDMIEHQEFLLKLLTKKDSFIRKALLNTRLPFLNTRLKHYLDKLGLPHKVLFTEEMSVKISQFGSELQFGNLSDGQKARVNLAMSFAFRDVLQSRFGKIGFCILDECLDTGLGNVGVQLAAKMVKEIALEHLLSMFIISHKDEIATMFDSKLEVELRNGFSKIQDSPLLLVDEEFNENE